MIPTIRPYFAAVSRAARSALPVALVATLSMMLCVLPTQAPAQPFPNKPVKLIVPFPPGGPTDAAARLIAQKMTEGLGQQVVVETRAGASGIPGTEAGARAAPDGYTLTYATTSTFSILPSLSTTLPYDWKKSFAPISMVANGPLLVVVHADVPAKTLQEFIALARSQPRVLNYGSAGNGTVPHLAGELFKSLAEVDVVHVPYKGSGPAQSDLIAGRLQAMFDAVAPLLPNVRAGKLRALAIASDKRLALMPDTPTAAEAGLPGYEVGLWNGVLAPAGTPREVITALNGAIRKALAEPSTGETLLRYGLVPAGNTPEAFAAAMETEAARWARVIKTSGTKLD
jgi:tripartite-type tricarboxylate transporter receptor subunit TctC